VIQPFFIFFLFFFALNWLDLKIVGSLKLVTGLHIAIGVKIE